MKLPTTDNPGRAEIENGDIEIRDLGIRDIAGFSVLRHQLARDGRFVLPEFDEIVSSKDSFPEQVARTLNDPLKKRLVALYRGRVAGFVSATLVDGHARHLAIGISEAFTGRGIGRSLMDALESWARASGAQRLELRVLVQNERAIALYQRCGFAIEGHMRGEFCIGGKLVDAYAMGKLLS